MGFTVAARAKGDEILSRIISELAALLDVVNLKVPSTPATLASPAVLVKNFPT